MKRLGVPWPMAALGAALLALTLYGATGLYAPEHGTVIRAALLQAPFLAAAAILLWFFRDRLPGLQSKRTLVFILGLAAIMRAVLVFAPPHSTDIYRYVWDGRVQAGGINPYRYIPADPALAHLRDADAIYPHINRRDYAPTIYPPMAQLVFAAAGQIRQSVTMMKLVMLGFEALAIWAIILLLRSRGLPLALVAVYAWHPLALWEIAGSGHVDIIAVAFLLLAMLAAERGSRFAAGAALAAGVLAKYFPLAIAPAIWRRGDWKMPAGFVAAMLVLSLPYLGAGGKMLGFLGGYAGEAGLATGEGLLLAVILKQAGFGDGSLPLFLIFGAALLGGLALLAVFRKDPDRPGLPVALALATAFTALLSPPHAWYFLWLIPLLCFTPSLAVLYLTLSASALYWLGWPPSIAGAAVVYAPFLILLVMENLKIFSPKEARRGRAIA
ncbi:MULTISPECIES: glycosyltransferase 87 family protein [Rhodomicrobium]|uniref:glycosyltransferase 87 family protein n=1 Tax=Rhodomicrobium TaxID=1068 RepID=UPI000B4BF1C7|nr:MULTISPECIES: glycosyltransferase 87 family protein [Rhodomicrobium]